MVSEDEDHRFIQTACEEAEEAQRKVPSRDNHLHVAEAFFDAVGVHEGVDLVGHTENSHGIDQLKIRLFQ